MAERLTGMLTNLQPRGYGFIHTKADGDYYVHVSAMRDRSEWVEGAEVSFTPGIALGRKAPPAEDVAAIK